MPILWYILKFYHQLYEHRSLMYVQRILLDELNYSFIVKPKIIGYE